MKGFIAELLINIVMPKFLIISLKFAGISIYLRGPVSINGVQKTKKKNIIIPVASADLVSFRKCI
jgi:hypothetical protein